MGSRGLGRVRAAVGSTVLDLLHDAPCPVLVGLTRPLTSPPLDGIPARRGDDLRGEPAARVRASDMGGAGSVSVQLRPGCGAARAGGCARGGVGAVRAGQRRAARPRMSAQAQGEHRGRERARAARQPAQGGRRARPVRALAGAVRAAVRGCRADDVATAAAHARILRRQARLVLALRRRRVGGEGLPRRGRHGLAHLPGRHRAAGRDAGCLVALLRVDWVRVLEREAR